MEAMHTVIYGEGAQTLRHTPHDRNGRARRVTSATYRIVNLRYSKDSTDRTIVADTAATLPSVSEVLTATAGPSTTYSRRITVGDASVFDIGRRYVLTENSDTELVIVDSIDTSNNYVIASHPVAGSYTTAAALQSIELEATFPTAEADDEDETVEQSTTLYQVIWDYTLDGREWMVPELVDVKRYSPDAVWITREDLLRGHPGLAKRLSVTDADAAIAIAQEDVRGELEANGIEPSLYRHSTVGKVAVRYSALATAFGWLYGDDDERWETKYREMATNKLHDMFNGKAPVGTAMLEEKSDERVDPDDYGGIIVRP